MNRVVTARPDQQTARAYWTMSRGDSERAFRSARRHSRVVRVLRVTIPVTVLIALTGIALVTYFNPLRMLNKLPIDISDLVVSGTKLKMEQPHLSGFTSDSRAYELSADTAAQDFTKPNLVELRNLRAKIEMQDKSTMELTALSGLYDTKEETIKLERNILLGSSGGYKGRLSEATVDIRKGHVVSDKPVELEFLQGTLNANRLEIVDSGELVRFHGGVNMVMMMDGSSPKRTPGSR